MSSMLSKPGLPGGSVNTASDSLVLDEFTRKDLELFEAENGVSLFQFCNRTRTRGGAAVLRRRMERPWSSSERIRATQTSVAHIIKHQSAFNKMPSADSIDWVEHYLHEILPIITYRNPFEFAFSAFSLRFNNPRHYLGIVAGVRFVCGWIRALRKYLGQVELAAPKGEIKLLLDEMRALLARPGLAKVPDTGVAGWTWVILRLDQAFRLHERDALARLLELLYELDALVAMAEVTRENAFVFPSIEEGSLRVDAEGLVHPFVIDPVANPVELDQDRRILFLTGPNMAGKTTYLRAFGTALYLAHLGMGVPAQRFAFVPVQYLFTAISLSDDLRSGISYFRAEALRVKAIAEAVAGGYRVVAIMDEPFKGTNVKDAFDASLAILERFATKQDCLFMFSSHLIELGERLASTNQIDFRYFQADEGTDQLSFDYQLHAGISAQRLGMRVLREEGVFELLDTTD